MGEQWKPIRIIILLLAIAQLAFGIYANLPIAASFAGYLIGKAIWVGERDSYMITGMWRRGEAKRGV